jgi:cytochrome c oxidase subunit 3
MATDTVVQQDVQKDENAWSGGKQPFKASYGKLMMWYFLLSDAFTFAAFLIAYGALRFSMPTWPVPDFVFAKIPFYSGEAPLIFVTFMTFILIVSSVTMVRAVQEGHEGNQKGVVKWMVWTIIGGSIFLGSQAWEWNTLISGEGVTVTKNPFSNHEESGTYLSAEEIKKEGFNEVSKDGATYYLAANAADIPENRFFVKSTHSKSFDDLQKDDELSFEANDPYLITYSHDTYLYEAGAYKTAGGEVKKEVYGPKAFGALFFFITGFHGFHVLSGVVFLIIITMNVASGLYHNRGNKYEMVEKMGLYWHFVDLVWVFVLLVFYLL